MQENGGLGGGPVTRAGKRVRRRHRDARPVVLLLGLAATLAEAGGMAPAQFLEQHGSAAALGTGDYTSVTAALDEPYRFFIEVPPGTPSLVVDLFDADCGLGGGGEVYDRASGGFNTSVRYQLFDPAGTLVATLTGSATAPAGANGAWLNLYTVATPQSGHWELVSDSSSAVTAGDDRCGYSVRAHDGDPTAAGTELNVYAESYMQMGVHAGAAVTWTLHPYVTAGGSTASAGMACDFDLDGNGSIAQASRSGAFTHPHPAVSANAVWRSEALSGWTSDYVADDYGIWTSTIRVSGAPNYVTYYLGDWTTATPPPTAQPEPGSYRVYLQNDAGAAPRKPYVAQWLSWMSGLNPPAAGSSTVVRILVEVTNPTPHAIAFASGNEVTVNVPGGAAGFAGNLAATAGTIGDSPVPGAGGRVLWDPGVVGPTSSATLSFDVSVTPPAPGARVELTGNPASGGTTAVFLDETANAAQARATYTFGPLSELAATEGLLLPGDSDGDAIPDLIETDADDDGDGQPNRLDLDADNDGIEDSVERLVDTDGDGTSDFLDLDSDGDGAFDLIEGNDADRDGRTDHAVVDADRDGVIDVIVDADSDGLDDAYDTTLGGVSAATQDTDGDGTPDWRDVDDDGDGIPTAAEDANGNGDWSDDDPDRDLRPAYLDVDADGDGIPDATEGLADTDGDGIADFLDLDADNDGVPDAVEGGADTDGDGTPDFRDRDSDGDGIPDTREAGAPDADGDGVVDGFIDLDGDGLHDPYSTSPLPPLDADRDGHVDHLDLDSDNDGVPDAVEGTPDTDGDGVSDWRDVDADDDGITDCREAAGPDPGPDADGDGRIDALADLNGNGLADSVDPWASPPGVPLAVSDTDGTGLPDYRDADADDDGLPDVEEGFDPDRPGLGVDADGDGLDDAWDPDAGVPAGVPANLPDADADGLRDWRDPLSCLVANIPPVYPVKAVRASNDVALAWPPTPDAESFTSWMVDGTAAASNKSAIPAAREGGPWPSVASCYRSPGTACVDAGAVTGLPGDVRFYQVRGVCGPSEAAE